jgi:hypothetical protein
MNLHLPLNLFRITKGTSEINFLLGCDYFRDEDGVLCMIPKKYIAKMEETFERLFGEKPKPGCYRVP